MLPWLARRWRHDECAFHRNPHLEARCLVARQGHDRVAGRTGPAEPVWLGYINDDTWRFIDDMLQRRLTELMVLPDLTKVIHERRQRGSSDSRISETYIRVLPKP